MKDSTTFLYLSIEGGDVLWVAMRFPQSKITHFVGECELKSAKAKSTITIIKRTNRMTKK